MYEDKEKEIREYSAAIELVGLRNANSLLTILDELKGEIIMENMNNEMLKTTEFRRKKYHNVDEINETMSAITENFADSMRRTVMSNYGISRLSEKWKSIVVDINVIVPDKVVEVIFADGGRQKTVCAEGDTYSLEQAISICIAKNLIGGTSNYNKAVNDGMKVYEKNIARDKADKAEEERIKAKKAKLSAKRAERIARRKAKEIEEQIEIQKEAIIRANKEISNKTK